MMRKRQICILVVAAAFLVFAACMGQNSMAQKSQTATAKKSQTATVKKMHITGEIAKGDHAYIIRGKVPAEIFTILNPDSKVLNELVKTGKIVQLEVRIVSGDNVEIKMIDGQEYSGGGS
ncbi:MAG: hypothetical protein P8130_13575 [Deltaproteobacteria bacterium]